MADRRVYQTKYGGPLDPPEEQGDCMRAALATLLGITLEEAFDFNEAYQERRSRWWLAFVRWAEARGLAVIALEWPPLPGVLGLAAVESAGLVERDGKPAGHEVVICGDAVVHDPNSRTPQNSYRLFREPRPFIYLLPFDPGAPSTGFGGALPALPGHPRIEALNG